MHPKIPKNLILINASKSYLKLTTRNFPNDENSQWVKTFKKSEGKLRDHLDQKRKTHSQQNQNKTNIQHHQKNK